MMMILLCWLPTDGKESALALALALVVRVEDAPTTSYDAHTILS